MSDLKTIVELSHEFGTDDYVKGGGGNTSFKNETTLWVKPSGTTLGGLTESTFVAINRSKIDELYVAETPALAADREELVKNLMGAAVENDAGRPSVEAPLHNVFNVPYVVHTHPCLVNGMTCAIDGEAACAEMFPQALWVEYIDPGYTLCMVVRERIEAYKAANGFEPKLVVLANHGIFVSAETEEEIRALYSEVMSKLETAYATADVSAELTIADAAEDATEMALIKELFGTDAEGVACCGMFDFAKGPLTPDHIVYSKSFPFTAELTAEAVASYKTERGYTPKVVVTAERVYGIGTSQKNAELSLELAQDGAQVMKLVEAFGGVEFMSTAHREFIENWEVESYRQKQMG